MRCPWWLFAAAACHMISNGKIPSRHFTSDASFGEAQDFLFRLLWEVFRRPELGRGSSMILRACTQIWSHFVGPWNNWNLLKIHTYTRSYLVEIDYLVWNTYAIIAFTFSHVFNPFISRVTRNGYFESFYSVNWHFCKLFGHFSWIHSDYSSQGDQKWPFYSVNWHFLKLFGLCQINFIPKIFENIWAPKSIELETV